MAQESRENHLELLRISESLFTFVHWKTMVVSITDAPPAVWGKDEIQSLQADYPELRDSYDAATKYNPTPGTGRTGFMNVPPNNYPFYSDEEKYVPVMQADGGQLSEWKPMYNPTAEQAEADRKKAYETGVPHGFVAPGDKYKGLPTIALPVVSDLHSPEEYGEKVDANGKHSGGPFVLHVSPKMRIEELRKVIMVSCMLCKKDYVVVWYLQSIMNESQWNNNKMQDKSGIIPALQKFSYAGKNLEDSQRTLEQYGIAYWNKKFPGWPLKIRRC